MASTYKRIPVESGGGGGGEITTPVSIANGGTGSTTASSARTSLGLAIGSDVQAYDSVLALLAADTPLPIANGGTNAATESNARTNLGLAIGTDVQAQNAALQAIADGTDLPVADGGTGASTAGDARTNLGLVIGTDVQAQNALLQSLADGTDLPIANGGTGASTAAAAVTALGLDNTKIAAVGITIDGGGSAITTGVKGFIEVPYACTINRVTMLADQSGSVVVDIWKDSLANYPPTDADSITASAVPTISTATNSQDTTLTGWTTAVAAGDILGFNVDSATTITRLNLILKVTKT